MSCYMSRHLAVALAAIGLNGCATRPESIHASFVSHEKFVYLDCAALTARMSDTKAELEKLSRQQHYWANADAVGVFLVLVPVSKLVGDYEGDIARLKGEVEAIETAQVKIKCIPLPNIAVKNASLVAGTAQ